MIYPAIGNDIVDLANGDCRGVLHNHRFIERVFSENEREQIFQSADSATLLWSIWACKESAYKAMRRLDRNIIFAHKKFEVSNDLTYVIYENQQIDSHVYCTPSLASATAIIHGTHAEVSSDIFEIQNTGEITNVERSSQVRRLLVQLAQKAFAVPPDQLHVPQPMNKEPPVLMLGKEIFSSAISLSHHGRFVAAAIHNPTQVL